MYLTLQICKVAFSITVYFFHSYGDKMNKRITKAGLSILLVVMLLIGVTGVALAFDSGNNPGATGDTTITWTGQGADKGVLNSNICPADATLPDGIDPNSYLHWILTTDGGSADTNATLHLGGTGSGDYVTAKDSGGAFHFYTPYFVPDGGLKAYADITVLTTGKGAWNLTISHGCPGFKDNGHDLTVSKTAAASYKRTYDWKIEKTVAEPSTVYSSDGTSSFDYTVTLTKDAGTDSNFAVSGEITVNNPNDFGVSGVNVTDSLCEITGGSDLVVPAQGSATVKYVCAFDSKPVDGTNTATATWNKDTYKTPNASASGSADYIFGDPTEVVNETIDVTDTNGQSWKFSDSGSETYTTKFEGDPAGTCTTHENTATITQTKASANADATVCVGANLTVVKTADASFKRTYKWEIAKNVDKTYVTSSDGKSTFNYTVDVTKTGYTDSDWKVAGTISVTNPNDWQDVTVNLTDQIDNGGLCDLDANSVTVKANGTEQVGYSCKFSSAADGTNVVVISWNKDTYKTPNASASGEAGYKFGDPTEVVNGTVNVTDTNGKSWKFSDTGSETYTTKFEGDPAGTCTTHENTATITETGDKAKVDVKVCVGANLTVVKTATPTFKRTFDWTISKDVDKTVVRQFGGIASFNYTISASQTGVIDSDWKATGTITITNPNDWQSVDVNLSDLVDNGGECAPDQAAVTVPASESREVGYSCTFTSGASGTNTATASWNKETYSTSEESASGKASFEFVTPTEVVNKDVTINDTFDGTTVKLGTLSANATEPFASAQYTYAKTLSVPLYNCLSYTNTAEIQETGQSDSQTVKVCGPAKTGAHTMGFWQNNNGQAIIKTGASVSGICKSGTWLRQFAPFQGLSSSASCSTVATFVYNTIKAANASGASMNAMLKGQMLATALDVYFSDPALGGNKISAPAPIGSLSIDLTKICKDLTCVAFENSSSVFGGSPKTVLEMLTYAASKSNAGGTTWYGNVKTTQELAKDAFDALNNQKVFIY